MTDKESNEEENILYRQSGAFACMDNLNYDNHKIINTLRSQQSLGTEEFKFLPNMILEMQEALTKSNNNLLDLKNKLGESISREKILKFKNSEQLNEISTLKLKLSDLKNENRQIQEKEVECMHLLEKANRDLRESSRQLDAKSESIK